MQAQFEILEIAATLSGPSDVLQPIVTAYRRFLTTRPASRTDVRVRLDSREAGSIRVNDREVPRVDRMNLTLQVYRHFLVQLFERIDSFAVIHAAALTDDSGNAFLLAAPSGHGKSSLTLALVGRGRGFLSDDYAPLDIAERKIAPYPRAVGVIPHGSAGIPPHILEMAGKPSTVRLFEKGLIDVGDALGETSLVRDAAPLRTVFLLEHAATPTDDRSTVTRFQAIVRLEEADRVERRLSRIDGVELLETRVLGCTRACSFRVQRRAASEVQRTLDDEAIVFSERLPSETPDFSSPARLAPIKRREAAVFLCREMLNRGPGGRLLARYDDDVTRLYLEVAAALENASCWRVTVGDFETTVQLIDDMVCRG